jgi:hypothetical protein
MECRDTFSELFTFYDENILPDLEEKLLEARNLAKELQEQHGVPMDFDDAIYFKHLDKLKRQKVISVFLIVFMIVLGFAVWHLWPDIDPRTKATEEIDKINRETFWAPNGTKISLRNESLQALNLNVNATRHFIHYKSNCVFMTMNAIYQLLNATNSMKTNILVNLESLKKGTSKALTQGNFEKEKSLKNLSSNY